MAYKQSKITSGNHPDFGKKVYIFGYYSLVSDNSGSVNLYRRTIDGDWEYIGAITQASSGSSYGDSISVSNSYIVIGEPLYDSGKGRVGIFSWDDPTVLIEEYVGAESGCFFGSSLSISRDYLLIGSYGANLNAGEVHLYITGEGDDWVEYNNNPISPSALKADDYFGHQVAISDSNMIIGAYGDNNKRGAIYVYNYDRISNSCDQTQKILAIDGDINDQFGISLSASGEYFVVGANRAEHFSGEPNAGAVYIYKRGARWNVVDKLIGTDEESYRGNYFGDSVCINDDYIVVGSPYARGRGVVDIFYKRRSWGHLKKIWGSDSVEGDEFGKSVFVSGRFLIVGASSAGDFGNVYYFEDVPSRVRLAQEFTVNKEYVPSKASVYLKRYGSNYSNCWDIRNTSRTVIDSSNFSDITQESNIIIFDDSIPGFTGNGYMIMDNDDALNFSVINYPIRTFTPDKFYLWMRFLLIDGDEFEIDILLDGEKIRSLSGEVDNTSLLTWEWIGTSIVIPDSRDHILGVKIKKKGLAIDKIYIDALGIEPYAEGPDCSSSPYLTVHMKMYDSLDNVPGESLFVYDYKNSLRHIVQSDWYNFNIRVLDNSHGYLEKNDFDDRYFLVLSCSGTDYDNFILWEMKDNDEYVDTPSGFKF